MNMKLSLHSYKDVGWGFSRTVCWVLLRRKQEEGGHNRTVVAA
jgi:hypothetical protein